MISITTLVVTGAAVTGAIVATATPRITTNGTTSVTTTTHAIRIAIKTIESKTQLRLHCTLECQLHGLLTRHVQL